MSFVALTVFGVCGLSVWFAPAAGLFEDGRHTHCAANDPGLDQSRPNSLAC